MRRFAVVLLVAIASELVIGCGNDPDETAMHAGDRYTITILNEDSPSEVRRWAVWACSRPPMTSLIEQANGRTTSAAIARAQAHRFPQATRKAAYAGCLDGLRSYRGNW